MKCFKYDINVMYFGLGGIRIFALYFHIPSAMIGKEGLRSSGYLIP